ncbi:iris-like [Haemaphysalis longicornis]
MSLASSVSDRRPSDPEDQPSRQWFPNNSSSSSASARYTSSSEQDSTCSASSFRQIMVTAPPTPISEIERYLRSAFVMAPHVAGPLLQFPIDVYLRMRQDEEKGNVILSPWYLACALVIMYHGASGETRRQIANVIHTDDDGSIVHILDNHASRMFCRDYRKTHHTHSGLTVTAHSGLYYDSRVKLSGYFLEPLSSIDVSVQKRDFARSPSQCRLALNGLLRALSGFTFDEDVFGGDCVDADAMLVLASVFAFGSRWFSVGNAHRSTGPFHDESAEATAVEEIVPTVCLTGNFRVGEFADFEGFNATVLEIPYQDPRRSLAIFLPAPTSSLVALEKKLTAAKILTCLRRLEHNKLVEVILPRVTVHCVTDLKRHLQPLGAVSVFSNTSDLSSVGPLRGLRVSAAKHVAVFRVGHRGAKTAEAQEAAENVVKAFAGAPVKTVTVDRPFLFLVVSRNPDTVLLLGSITHVH